MDYPRFKQSRKKKLRLTKEGLDRLKKKLDDITISRHMAIRELRSMSDGDTDELSFSAQIQRLEDIEKESLALSELLRHVGLAIAPEVPEKVTLGCTVGLKSTGRTVHYTIVCSLEVDIESNRISEDSILGKAIAGKKVGDMFSITTPKGSVLSYTVISIR